MEQSARLQAAKVRRAKRIAKQAAHLKAMRTKKWVLEGVVSDLKVDPIYQESLAHLQRA
jgi:hypothetical protein